MKKNSEAGTKPALSAGTRLKTVTIRHHHAKAYRKRHYVSFLSLLISGIVLIGLSVHYKTQLKSGVQSAKDFITGSSTNSESANQMVASTYGFSVTYDARQLYASGVDSATGDLFIGNELSVNRPYELIRMSPILGDTSFESSNSNLTIHYYPKNTVTDPSNLTAIEAAAIKDVTAKATLVAKKTGTSNILLGGKAFLKTDWIFSSENKVFSGFNPSFTTYTAVLNNKPIVIEIINSALTGQKSINYEDVLKSLYFGPAKRTYVAPTKAAEVSYQQSRNIIESLVFGQLVSAQAPVTDTNSQQISSVYGPAVVKIFNVYCQDIYFDGKLAIRDACSGSTGSGFFVNQDGHIASNGHVTSSDPKDILIQFAYNYLRKGDTRLLDYLALQEKIVSTDLPKGTYQDRADFLFDKLYGIDAARITTQNSATNLLVALGKDVPDVKELVAVTTKRQEYAEQANIKRAKVIAQDFRSIDGVTKFHASDVSIIKIDGSGYPVTKLGNITTLLQGANLSILGYPANASNNGIVDAGLSTVTLTSGKVSSIKNALGSDKKLIETDTTIGHGNSGGPAFNDSGEVVGISTYTATKDGDGTYNYVRDIRDLIGLASSASVVLDSKSTTQTEWEKALDSFNTAHYSKAVKGFSVVKKLYPSHPKVEEFIAAANENIKNGKNVTDFPIIAALIGGFVLLLGSAVAVVMIVRHKKTHNVYKTHVAAGMMHPIPRGAAPQTVSYDPLVVAAQKNVQTMQLHTLEPKAQDEEIQGTTQ